MKISRRFIALVLVGFFGLAFFTSILFAETFSVSIKGSKQGVFKGDFNQVQKNKITGYGILHEVVASRDSATGLPSGVIQHKPLTIVKKWGPSTPQIMQALGTNEILTEVVIDFTKLDATGTEYVYFRVKLTNATVCNVRQASANMLGTEYPHLFPDTTGFRKVVTTNMELELVSFTYQRIAWESFDGATMAYDDWTK